MLAVMMTRTMQTAPEANWVGLSQEHKVSPWLRRVRLKIERGGVTGNSGKTILDKAGAGKIAVPFADDRGIGSDLLKTAKCVMADEYSPELSGKTVRP